ncbi:adenylate/guanylate cyclase domain-containing protein [Bradyrhizobium sp. AUGA SZCCT0431]|uniref:adenylate/guanylate cyclase domain-containing protein n=1 Tax=Bradyrhizobium sp. AUGA SZCCT0431 TaxID=2807674 RepID=UPI001BAB3F22|nr:adenylate/guanylate cyclase domain-containing protein [Bradyrhizobium sp. AUGA SZCCT0431]MBR1143028.1 adenylate/guanylate cyclase domain-containing protein [Bradyrhizobium sp. AUGA SZCCT0431]
MRLIPNIRYGTERYPEKVARRLRATNIAAWIGASTIALFAVWRFFGGMAHWKYAALVALAYGLTPLLHRFSPLAAPLALAGLMYAWNSWLGFNFGITNGVTFFYFTAGALGLLLLGAEHVFLSIVIGAVGAALLVVLHIGDANNTPTSHLTFVINVLCSSAALYGIVFYAVRQYTRAEERAERERQRSESLLVNILPPSIAGRLKDHPDVAIADAYPEASILFADMAGFTARASDTTPEELVGFLNSVYMRLDSLVERHDLEKIKTTGDAYMVVSGLPNPQPDHAMALADLALDMQVALVGLVDPKGRAVPVRMGIASGPVVAGVVGTRKFFYDVWGDAVNTASRMESTGEPGKIQVASRTRELLAGCFELEERGIIEVRGKGPMPTWFLIGRKPTQSKFGRVRPDKGNFYVGR